MPDLQKISQLTELVGVSNDLPVPTVHLHSKWLPFYERKNPALRKSRAFVFVGWLAF